MAAESNEAAVETHASVQHEPGPLLQFDPGIGIWTFLSFIILLVLLKKFAWKPILDSIDERERLMKESLTHAEQVNEEARQTAEKQKQILAESHEQAAKILVDARQAAIAMHEQIVENAKDERARQLQHAQDEITQMTAQAKSELRKFSAELAVNAAERILVDQLDHSKAKNLADKLVGEFKA